MAKASGNTGAFFMPAGRNKSSEAPKVIIVGCKKTQGPGVPSHPGFLEHRSNPVGNPATPLPVVVTITQGAGGVKHKKCTIDTPTGAGRPQAGGGGCRASDGPPQAYRGHRGTRQGQGLQAGR